MSRRKRPPRIPWTRTPPPQGPVAAILTATDVFISSIAQMRADLTDGIRSLDAYETELRALRQAIENTLADREVDE